ncbi:MAG: hypothetical protein GY795_00270 [Desulfobacterales bacterium]|nr:hypothetical protein [Desulfobacterales bacterium]
MNCNNISQTKTIVTPSLLSELPHYRIYFALILAITAMLFAVNIIHDKNQVKSWEITRNAVISGDIEKIGQMFEQSPGLAYQESSRGWNLLHFASKNSQEHAVRFLLNAGINANSKTNTGLSPLHFAVQEGNTETAGILLSGGAKADSADYRGFAPMHRVDSNHKELVELLLKNGATVNARSQSGLTPLHLAVRRGNMEAASFFISKGAMVNAVTDTDWTPLHYAASGGHDEIIKILLARGAELNSKTMTGRTPLICAANSFKPGTAEFIRKLGGIE